VGIIKWSESVIRWNSSVSKVYLKVHMSEFGVTKNMRVDYMTRYEESSG